MFWKLSSQSAEAIEEAGSQWSIVQEYRGGQVIYPQTCFAIEKCESNMLNKIIPDCGVLGSRAEKFLPQTRLDDVEIRYNPGSFA